MTKDKYKKGKGFAITLPEFEDVAENEIKELIDSDCKKKDSVVTFNISRPEDLFTLCYKAQSVFKVFYHLGECDVSDDFEEALSGIKKMVLESALDEWLNKNISFKAFCKRIGTQEFSSQDMAIEIGGIIADKTKAPVSMTAPQVRVYIYIYHEKAYLGIDFSGFDLSKREYKVFSSPKDISSILAFSMVGLSDIKKDDIILDPFCLSSTIAIETALYTSGFSPNHYKKDKFAFIRLPDFKNFDYEKFFDDIDKNAKKIPVKIYSYDDLLAHIKASQKNAKIAGINKEIAFSKQPTEWLDTKFDKNSVTKIITQLPHLTKFTDKKKVLKQYKELFYQAEFILKKDGIICLLTKNPVELLEFNNSGKFEVIEERAISRGEEHYILIVLKKK